MLKSKKVRLTKTGAKRSCALAVVEELFRRGELDQRLKVRKRRNIPLEDDNEGDEDGGGKVGTRKRRRFYQKKIPEMLTREGASLYVHVVKMAVVNPISDPRRVVQLKGNK